MKSNRILPRLDSRCRQQGELRAYQGSLWTFISPFSYGRDNIPQSSVTVAIQAAGNNTGVAGRDDHQRISRLQCPRKESLDLTNVDRGSLPLWYQSQDNLSIGSGPSVGGIFRLRLSEFRNVPNRSMDPDVLRWEIIL